MADDDKKLEGQEGNEGDAGNGEGTKKPEGQEGGQGDKKPESNDEGTKDSHGQPGINREKYQRDIKERDDRIAELEAKVAEAAETKEGREKLEADLKALREEIADKDASHSLEMAGCVNVKAAKAVLADYGGDVSKLKAECPYLFEKEKQTGSVGGKPGGAPSTADERRKRAREAAGLE